MIKYSFLISFICFLFSSLLNILFYNFLRPKGWVLYDSPYAFFLAGLFSIYWFYLILTFVYLKWGIKCKTIKCLIVKALIICIIGVFLTNVPNIWDLQFTTLSEITWTTSGQNLFFLSVAPVLYFTSKYLYFNKLDHWSKR